MDQSEMAPEICRLFSSFPCRHMNSIKKKTINLKVINFNMIIVTKLSHRW